MSEKRLREVLERALIKLKRMVRRQSLIELKDRNEASARTPENVKMLRKLYRITNSQALRGEKI